MTLSFSFVSYTSLNSEASTPVLKFRAPIFFHQTHRQAESACGIPARVSGRRQQLVATHASSSSKHLGVANSKHVRVARSLLLTLQDGQNLRFYNLTTDCRH